MTKSVAIALSLKLLAKHCSCDNAGITRGNDVNVIGDCTVISLFYAHEYTVL